MPTRLLAAFALTLATAAASAQVVEVRATTVPEAVAAIAARLNASGPAARGIVPGAGVGFAASAKLRGLGSVTHHRFRQLGPGGHPVVGGHLVVHESPKSVTATSSAVPAGRFSDIGVASAISVDAARLRAERSTAARRFRPAEELDPTEPVWVPPALDFAKANYRLAHRVDVYASAPTLREYVYVDASTGEVLAREPRILHTEEPGTAETRYHGTQSIVTQRLDSVGYRLYQAEARGTVIHTRDFRNGFGPDYEEFLDEDNTWTGTNERQDEVARDAFWASGAYHDLLTELGYHSIDNAGYPLICNVHVDSNLVNAYWDGRASYYGDGSPESRLDAPLTSIDIVAHEFTHGLTQFSAGLIYANESGALNESFSDIYGVATRLAALPDRAGDYSIGSDVDRTGRGIRSMSDPNAFEDPDTYEGDFYYTGSADRGGVHVNSGVQNHWFYLLSEGGAGVNDHGRAYAVEGIGWEEALRVAHETLTGYLTPSSTYPDAAEASVAAAEALFGICDARTAAVAEAWAAVGLPVRTLANGLTVSASQTRVCDPAATITLRANVPEGTDVTWDLGDGTRASGAVVEHAYGSPGTYAVTAFAIDCEGQPDTATVPGGIVVDPDAIRCTTFALPNAGERTVEACAGLVTHAEGEDPYSNRVDGRLFVKTPTAASGYMLVVEAFDLERGYDYLTISGFDERGDSLHVGRFTGADLGAGDTLIVDAPRVGFAFRTDGSVVADGFAITFEALGTADLEPVAALRRTDTAAAPLIFRPVAFASNGALGSLTYDFGDGTAVRAAVGKVVEHVYTRPGEYVVRQVARTCSASDTAHLTVTISAGSRACLEGDTTYLALERDRTGIFTRTVRNCGDGPLYLEPASRRLSTAFRSTRHLDREDRTYHHFPALDKNRVDSQIASLRVRYSGDFDEPDEYLTVSVGYERVELRDDGDPANGTPIEAVVPIPAHVAADMRRYGLRVETYGSGGVEDRAGAFRSVALELGFLSPTVATQTDSVIPPGSSFEVAVAVPTTGLPGGTYRYSEGLAVTDTSLPGGRLGIPVALTVGGRDELRFRDAEIDLGEVYAGTTSYPDTRLLNLGPDEAVIAAVEIGPSLSVDLHAGSALAADADQYLYLRHSAPRKSGPFVDSVRVRSTAGSETVVRVRGVVPPPGELRPVPDSTLTGTVLAGTIADRVLVLHNDGLGELDLRLSLYGWRGGVELTAGNYQSITIAPQDSVVVPYIVDASDVPAGEAIEADLEIYLRRTREYIRLPIAFRAVAGAYARFDAPARLCGGELNLSSWAEGDDLTYAWTLGDGSTASSQTVNHVYTADGTYEVTLAVCDSARCDTASATVAVSLECDEVVLDGGHATQVTMCQGRISGGPGRVDTTGYGIGFTTVVRSPGGSALTFTLTDFEEDDYWSDLVIYEGEGDEARHRRTFDRYSPIGTTVTIETGVATVNWRPDDWSDNASFGLDVACADSEAISASATASVDCSNEVSFDAFAFRADSYRWSFGDGAGDTAAVTSHTYAHPGSYRAVVYAIGPDGYADSLAVDVAIDAVPELTIITLDEPEAEAELTFAIEGQLGAGEVAVWRTSDGQSATGSLAQFTFPDSGAYMIEATARLADGCEAQASYPIAIQSAAAHDPADEPSAEDPSERASSVTDARVATLTIVPNPARERAGLRLAAPASAIVIRDGFGRIVARPAPAREAASLDLAGLAPVDSSPRRTLACRSRPVKITSRSSGRSSGAPARSGVSARPCTVFGTGRPAVAKTVGATSTRLTKFEATVPGRTPGPLTTSGTAVPRS